ncbi:hypothetical protein AKJ09_00118 [Labilithrix luteola]|uniref:Uncharacterized protein n=1 Tax=Labilithrix luteola TaxID=1391654 RepID=A0A0K1PK13_9BACT|nr:hypothetical protein AKJ09_00118 [Labilithrix luteola]
MAEVIDRAERRRRVTICPRIPVAGDIDRHVGRSRSVPWIDHRAAVGLGLNRRRRFVGRARRERSQRRNRDQNECREPFHWCSPVAPGFGPV